jgi:hypothetical protein
MIVVFTGPSDKPPLPPHTKKNGRRDLTIYERLFILFFKILFCSSLGCVADHARTYLPIYPPTYPHTFPPTCLPTRYARLSIIDFLPLLPPPAGPPSSRFIQCFRDFWKLSICGLPSPPTMNTNSNVLYLFS